MECCQTCEALITYLNLESSLILLPFMEREEAVTIISVQHSVLCFRLSTNTMLNTLMDLITFRLTLNTQPRNLLAPLPTEWITGHAHMTNPFNFLSMKILVWNCTGAGNQNFCRNFIDMVYSHCPSMPLFWRPAFLAKGQTLLALLLALTMSIAQMLMALEAASGFCGMLVTSPLTFSL